MKISFSHNWNNKLDCMAYSTIRLDGPHWKKGEVYEVNLKGKGKIHDAQLIDIRHIWLNDLNQFIAYLDTGYSLGELRAILLKMYPTVDFTKRKLALILFKKLK